MVAIAPELFPLQVKFVMTALLIVSGFGCVMVTLCELMQPWASVTKQVYVPGPMLTAIEEVCELGVHA